MLVFDSCMRFLSRCVSRIVAQVKAEMRKRERGKQADTADTADQDAKPKAKAKAKAKPRARGIRKAKQAEPEDGKSPSAAAPSASTNQGECQDTPKKVEENKPMSPAKNDEDMKEATTNQEKSSPNKRPTKSRKKNTEVDPKVAQKWAEKD